MCADNPSRRVFLGGRVVFLFSALVACGEPAVAPVGPAAESRSLRFECIYGVLVEAIVPPIRAGLATHAEVCFADRCGAATLHESNDPTPLGGALPGTLRLDGRATGLQVNVRENEVLRDGDVWRITITEGEKMVLSASQSVTYIPTWSYADGHDPVPQQCTGVTGRLGYFKVH